MKISRQGRSGEIFYSIQGEGKSLGKPSVFIRLALCNLYCFWCDTDYTWNWQNTSFPHVNDKMPGYKKFNKNEQIIDLADSEIVQKVLSFDCSNVVVSGGEPLVQHKALVSLFSELHKAIGELSIEIETNGTIVPTRQLDELTHQYNVSIKLSNSRVKKVDRLVDDAIRFFSLSPKATFKFVVDDAQDLLEILELKNDYEISPSNIFLMPQGTNQETLREKRQWIVEECLKYKFNFTDRMHIHLFGNRRGV